MSYAVSIRLRSDLDQVSFDYLTKKIISKLESFQAAYSAFRDVGLEPELESSDRDTANELKGLFISWVMESPTTFGDKLDEYYSKVVVCRNLVESYLKS